MIVGGYTLHLYCETEHPMDGEMEDYRAAHATEFAGRDERAAKRNARAAGWKFYKGDRVLCPLCISRGVKL